MQGFFRGIPRPMLEHWRVTPADLADIARGGGSRNPAQNFGFRRTFRVCVQPEVPPPLASALLEVPPTGIILPSPLVLIRTELLCCLDPVCCAALDQIETYTCRVAAVGALQKLHASDGCQARHMGQGCCRMRVQVLENMASAGKRAVVAFATGGGRAPVQDTEVLRVGLASGPPEHSHPDGILGRLPQVSHVGLGCPADACLFLTHLPVCGSMKGTGIAFHRYLPVCRRMNANIVLWLHECG